MNTLSTEMYIMLFVIGCILTISTFLMFQDVSHTNTTKHTNTTNNSSNGNLYAKLINNLSKLKSCIKNNKFMLFIFICMTAQVIFLYQENRRLKEEIKSVEEEIKSVEYEVSSNRRQIHYLEQEISIIKNYFASRNYYNY